MTASTTSELILQGVRSWLKACGARGGLTDSQVIIADEGGPRPPLPYLTVKITADDIPTGEDEPVAFNGDLVTVTGGSTGDIDVLTVNGLALERTRATGDSNATVAQAFVVLVEAAGDFLYAAADGAGFWVAAAHGPLETVGGPNLDVESGGATLRGTMMVRAATVSVQAFGVNGAMWLERAVEKLSMPSGEALLEAAGLSIRPTGGRTRISTALDTSIEARVLREFDVAYALRAEPESAVPFAQSDITVEIREYDGDPEPFTIDIVTEVS